jgi:hypothetical protein
MSLVEVVFGWSGDYRGTRTTGSRNRNTAMACRACGLPSRPAVSGVPVRHSAVPLLSSGAPSAELRLGRCCRKWLSLSIEPYAAAPYRDSRVDGLCGVDARAVTGA